MLLHLNTHRRALLRSAAGGLRSRRLRPSSHAAAVARPKLYHLRGAGAAGTNRCDVRTDDGFSITTDTPRAQGGSNEAAQPVLLLLASLCGCEHATARFVAFKMRRRIGKVDFDIHAERDERGARRERRDLSIHGLADLEALPPRRVRGAGRRRRLFGN